MSCATAGTTTDLMRNVSSSTPKATPEPISTSVTSGNTASTLNVAANTTPADEITGLCHEVLRELSSGGRCSSAAARLAEAADRWARRGSSLETVHHTVFETFRLHLEALRTSGDNLDTIMTSVGRVLDALEIVTTGVAELVSRSVI